MPSRGSRISENPELPSLIVLPAHALLILEERLAEQEAEGVELPEGMERESWLCGSWWQPKHYERERPVSLDSSVTGRLGAGRDRAPRFDQAPHLVEE
jgi:hypothetical protein